MATETVRAIATGNWLGDAEQLVVGLEDRLVLLDAADGRELFSAEWPGLVDLAVGDLDGDGDPELVVASGRRLTALFAPRKSQVKPEFGAK